LDKIARIMDCYVVNHPFVNTNVAQYPQNRFVTNTANNRSIPNNGSKIYDQTQMGARARPPCTVCGGISPDASHCFKVIGYPTFNQQTSSTAFKKKQNFPSINKMTPNKGYQGKNSNSNRIYRTKTVTVEDDQQRENNGCNEGNQEEEEEISPVEDDTQSINRITCSNVNCTVIAPEMGEGKQTLNSNVAPSIFSSKDTGHFVSLIIGGKSVQALVDSGAQISCLHPNMLPDDRGHRGAKPTEITLQGPFGQN